MVATNFMTHELGAARWYEVEPDGRKTRLCVSQGFTIYVHAVVMLSDYGAREPDPAFLTAPDAQTMIGLNDVWLEALNRAVSSGALGVPQNEYIATLLARRLPAAQWSEMDRIALTKLILYVSFYWRPFSTPRLPYARVQIDELSIVPFAMNQMPERVAQSVPDEPVCFSGDAELREIGIEVEGPMPNPVSPTSHDLPWNKTPVSMPVQNVRPVTAPQTKATSSSSASTAVVLVGASAVGATLYLLLRKK